MILTLGKQALAQYVMGPLDHFFPEGESLQKAFHLNKALPGIEVFCEVALPDILES